MKNKEKKNALLAIDDFRTRFQTTVIKRVSELHLTKGTLAKKLDMDIASLKELFEPDMNIDMRTLVKITRILGVKLVLVDDWCAFE